MNLRDVRKLFLGLNKDDDPQLLQQGEFVDALNTREASSEAQQGIGVKETLQGEVEILIGVEADIQYYGEAIGGSFNYSGFSEVTIGTQTWMKKNYDVNYPGSKVYNDVEANAAIYGRLYTHNMVMSADFCPPGFHVPTEAEIDTLLTYIGGALIGGGHLKEFDTSHWTTPNTGADDLFGFRALPGGKFDTLFELLGVNGLFWLQDEAVPFAPVALNGSVITPTTFIANWQTVNGATGYYLDVATDVLFTAFVAGYNNKDVGNVLFDAVTGLTPLTPYYFRVRAYNEVGSSDNSNTQPTTTKDGVIDIDGNVYTYVTIGTQQWLVENLRTINYADGTPIPNLTLNANWIAEDGTPGKDGAYCWYNNDISNKADYGALYNWYAVDNAHGLAPVGWRVPSKADLDTLVAFLLGESVTGGKLKEIGTSHWTTPNTGATDEYGFKLLPGGIRQNDGLFSNIHIWVHLWTSTPFGTSGYNRYVYYNTIAFVNSIHNKKYGFSIRCMRDAP